MRRLVVVLALVAGCRGSETNDTHEGDAKTLPRSCSEYRQMLDKLPVCDGVSKLELARFWWGYEDVSAAWVNRDLNRMPANTLRAIDVACTKGRNLIDNMLSSNNCSERVEEDRFGDRDPPERNLNLPSECENYRNWILKLQNCDKLPQQSRDALRQGYDAMMQSWTNAPNMPPEARKALAEACAAGSDALTQAAGSLCGWGN